MKIRELLEMGEGGGMGPDAAVAPPKGRNASELAQFAPQQIGVAPNPATTDPAMNVATAPIPAPNTAPPEQASQAVPPGTSMAASSTQQQNFTGPANGSL